MNSLNKLSELFVRFPGIGPRQSRRFVLFLLSQPRSFRSDLANTILSLEKSVQQCTDCLRFFSSTYLDQQKNPRCTICADRSRESHSLMLVEKDVDLDNIERSGEYKGHYFVLGGTIPILIKNPTDAIRLNDLLKRIERGSFTEVILALSATPDADNTAQFLKEKLTSLSGKKKLTISMLGRGLSTGSELEYSDKDTIKNALVNRK